MKKRSVEELKEIARDLRKKVVTMLYEAGSGHPGGALSAADFVTACYFSEINVDPKNPKWEERDRFVLSKGHSCPVLYAALGKLGFFPEETLHTLRQEGSPLQGHPNMNCPGIEIPTGSLGQGFACAVGMAIGLKMDKKNSRVFAVLGDGECQEGEVWESAATANKYKLDNLIAFVDYNKLQIDGTTDEIMPLGNISEKFKVFGFETYDIDGNDMEQILDTFDKIRAIAQNGKPKCIIGHTVKGKGVSFMENVCDWHGVAPKKEEYEQAMKDLEEGF
ncbi:MAG: transketolase [Selenomonadaceae bacterium]|nr:transketolase [Selenomonadaceae bacterium]